MLFNSLHFLFFFVIVTSLYFALPHKYRWFLLLVSSCYFYMTFLPIYILILGFTIVVDYAAGINIEKSAGKRRKLFLVLSLFANIGVLAVFKYYNFLNENLSVLLHLLHQSNPIPYISILLPIGLSFHSFQAMSYTIEVYRGKQKAERNFGIYSLYVMFYPQLVAGPIERPQNLLHQFYEKHNFDYDRVTGGLKLMAWGFFQKVVIADRLAQIADKVFDHPYNYHGLGCAIGILCFTFQIFCDFAGYTDIAIGAAQVMGIHLMSNFKRPYFAKSIPEFWRRWHISLSTWFKDYLYIPLGGSKVPVPRWYLNLFIVFLISGLWHGANWTFVVWGALHGFYMIVYSIYDSLKVKPLQLLKSKFPLKAGSVLLTFSIAAFTWIFFRAKRINEAVYIAKNVFKGWHLSSHYFGRTLLDLGIDKITLFYSMFLILLMESIHYYQEKHGSVRALISSKPIFVRWTIYYILIAAIMFLGVYEKRQFIYFQF